LKTIRAEIEQHMTEPMQESGTLTSRFSFPPGFIGFQGHFPEKKILPGVCQIQCVLSLIERAAGKPVVLKEVVLAKYFVPVFPDEELSCVVSGVSDASDAFICKANITKGGVKVSELKLKVMYSKGEQRPA